MLRLRGLFRSIFTWLWLLLSNNHRQKTASVLEAIEETEMMGSGALAIAEDKSVLESKSKPEVALEWSNIQIKFRVVCQDFQTNPMTYRYKAP